MANIDDLYDEVDRQNGLPQGMTRAIAEAETGHIADPLKRASAVSPKGARGWMQMMPGTADRYGVKNPMDMEQSIRGGGRYLGDLYRQFGKPHLVAAAYNAGEGNVQKYGGIPPFDETQKYVPKVVSGLRGSDPFETMQGGNMGPDPFDALESAKQSNNAKDPFDELEARLKESTKPFKVISSNDAEPDLSNPNANFAQNFLEGIANRGKDRLVGLKQTLSIGDPEELAHEVRLRKMESKSIDKSAGGKAGQFAADIGGGLALGGGAALAAPALGLTSPLWGPTAAIGGGALSGLLEPTEDRQEAESKVGEGAVGGLLGYAAGPIAQRIAKPITSKLAPEAERLAQLAKDKYGIELTPAMLTGSKPLKWLDSVFSDIPGTAGKQQTINEGIHKQFNKAISNTWGGAEDTITPSVIDAAKRRVGGEIGDVAERNALNYDNQLLNDLAQVKFDAAQFSTGNQPKVLDSYINALDSKVQNDGTVSGKAFRLWDSKIGRQMRETSDGDLRHQLGELRDTVRGAMDRSISQEDSDAWKAARRGYAAIKTVEPLANKSTVGDISEGLLLNQANKGSNPDLKELGRIGKEFLKDMPNSGTAPRKFYQDVLNNPLGTAVGSVAGLPARFFLQNAIHSPALRSYITKGLLDEESAKLLGRRAGLLGTPLGIDALQNLPLLLSTDNQQ